MWFRGDGCGGVGGAKEGTEVCSAGGVLLGVTKASDCSRMVSSRAMRTDLADERGGLLAVVDRGWRGNVGTAGLAGSVAAGLSASRISTSGSLTRFRDTSSSSSMSSTVFGSVGGSPIPPPAPRARPRNRCATRVRGLASPSSRLEFTSKVNWVVVLSLSRPSPRMSPRFRFGVVNGESAMVSGSCCEPGFRSQLRRRITAARQRREGWGCRAGDCRLACSVAHS